MAVVKFYTYSKLKKIVTGGHKYDSDLKNIIGEISGISVEETIIETGGGNPLVKSFKELRKGIQESRNADLIIFNSSKCLRFLPLMIWLRFFGRKTVYSIHHHFIFLEFKGIKRFVYKTAESLFLKWSNKIIVPSPYIYDILRKKKSENDLLLWRIPFETKAEFPLEPVPGNLSYTGTIEPRKGLIYLLEALKILKGKGMNLPLKIMGKVINEDYYKKLVNYIDEFGLDVTFTGFLDREEKNLNLSKTDIFTFPSLLEGFGMVLVEAQVYGLPIVCFDNSSMPFSVKNNENGFLVPTGNSEEMAERISQIVNDRSLRNRLSEGALENVKNQNTYSKFRKTVIDYFRANFK